jgi:hypothetical protein
MISKLSTAAPDPNPSRPPASPLLLFCDIYGFLGVPLLCPPCSRSLGAFYFCLCSWAFAIWLLILALQGFAVLDLLLPTSSSDNWKLNLLRTVGNQPGTACMPFHKSILSHIAIHLPPVPILLSIYQVCLGSWDGYVRLETCFPPTLHPSLDCGWAWVA